MKMENVNNGGPAFPVPLTDEQERDYDILNGNPHGMSLRDYFAAKAMQGWVCDPAMLNNQENRDYAANFAYAMADAMLAARN